MEHNTQVFCEYLEVSLVNLNLFKNVPKNIQIKLASSQAELEQAYKLLHDSYVARGYMEPHISEIRVTYYNALPQTSTIVAIVDEKVVGTLSIINNDSLILPIEREMDRNRYHSPAYRMAQVLDFVIQDKYKYSNVNFLLMKYVYEYAAKYLNVDSLQIAVPKNKTRFFQNVLGFTPLNQSFYDSSLQGLPFCALSLNLQDGYDFLAINHGKKPQAKNLFFYFTKFDFSQFFEFPERRFYSANDPVLTPQLLDHFFNYKTSILSQLSPEQLDYIRYIYDSSEYNQVIPHSLTNLTYLNLRRGKRFPVNCPGRIMSHSPIEFNINNVSPNGFSAHLNGQHMLILNQIFDVNVMINDYEVCSIKAKVVWKKSQSEYGFCLIKSSQNWNQFLEHLETRLLKVDQEDEDDSGSMAA